MKIIIYKPTKSSNKILKDMNIFFKIINNNMNIMQYSEEYLLLYYK